MSPGHGPSDEKSKELQEGVDRISARLDVRSTPVGLRTNDGLNVYVADDGAYHFTFYERGKLGFDRVGELDDVLYWYCEGIVSSQASKYAGDRKQRFLFMFEVLRQFNPEWAKRGVREMAAAFSNTEDIALLPDIGEPL